MLVESRSSFPHPSLAEGSSGFSLSALTPQIVEKRTNRRHGAERLRRQYEKQKAFTVRHPRFIVCPVMGHCEEDGDFSFRMPFFAADTARHFVGLASEGELVALAKDIIELAREFISHSHLTRIPYEIVRAKSVATLDSIRTRSEVPGLEPLARFHLRQLEAHRSGFWIPIGVCHGDLTFSNILFLRRPCRYVLIDFLDSYLESPLLDLAKLRQETKIHWSAIQHGTRADAKYAADMIRIDSLFEDAFNRFPFYRNYIDCFEFQNLLRVLQYVRDPDVTQAIVVRLRELAKGQAACA